jgi:transcriptional regulator GlxA family with amidase domain
MKPYLSAVGGLLTDAAGVVGRIVGSTLEERIESVRHFLEANLRQDLDLHTLSRHALISPYYLNRAFRAQVGVPPHRYLIGLRVDRAAELLLHTPLTVTQICHRVGFGSLSHFITTFRRHRGLSPARYRRMMIQPDMGTFRGEVDAHKSVRRRPDV